LFSDKPVAAGVVTINDIEIGSRLNGSSANFDGFLDDVHIYSQSLSLGKIEQLYLVGLEKHQGLALNLIK
jgi:hypothetical protein